MILEFGRRNLLSAVAHWADRRRTRGNPSEAREAYAVLRIWLWMKNDQSFERAEYVRRVARYSRGVSFYSVFVQGAWSCLIQNMM